MSLARNAIRNAVRHHLEAARHGEPAPEPIDRSTPPPGTPTGLDDAAARVERFRATLASVGGHVHRLDDARAAAAELEAILARHEARSLAISDSSLAGAVAGELDPGIEVLRDADRSQLLQVPLGLSGAQWGIAETGTLVLTSDEERHRLVSLLPPVHVAVLPETAILPDLGAALRAVHERGTAGMSRAVTFVTGPSRTADIELTLVVGVHGPRELHVLLLPDVSTP